MLRDLLPFICRRLGLSTIQLGILGLADAALGSGPKIAKRPGCDAVRRHAGA